MPKRITREYVPNEPSILEYDLNQGEEVFLTYTHGREHGPEIQRDGKGSPCMEHLYAQYPGETTTHPDGLRLRSWLIREELRVKDKKYGKDEQEKNSASPAAQAIYKSYAGEAGRLASHDDEFAKEYSGYQIIGQQGCGDLTMNLWNVAFINSPLSLKQEPRLIFLHQEPISKRTYSCLVKWKAKEERRPEMTIEGLRFNAHASDANEMVWSERENKWVGNDIEFAVSNQQIIRDGHIVKLSQLTHQFSDLRHLLRMPNLNPPNLDPPNPLFVGDPGRPRNYFSSTTYDDIWFGEAQLIKDINLQRAAMQGPIFLSRLDEGLGVSVEQLRGAMKQANYLEIADPRLELREGSYRFAPEDDKKVEVYFQRNIYGWTMLGLSKDNDKILSLACTADHRNRKGCKLEDAAYQLLNAGAHNALLIDEGVDVFQSALLDEARGLEDIVPINRNRLRATFIFARQQPASANEAQP